MPTLRIVRQLAAGEAVANMIAGSKFEFAPRNMAVKVFAVQDGGDDGDQTMDVTFGNAVEGDDLAIPTFTASMGPNTNEHEISKGVAMAGDRIQIKVVNGDAVNASNVRLLLDLRPV